MQYETLQETYTHRQPVICIYDRNVFLFLSAQHRDERNREMAYRSRFIRSAHNTVVHTETEISFEKEKRGRTQ